MARPIRNFENGKNGGNGAGLVLRAMGSGVKEETKNETKEDKDKEEDKGVKSSNIYYPQLGSVRSLIRRIGLWC